MIVKSDLTKEDPKLEIERLRQRLRDKQDEIENLSRIIITIGRGNANE